jgi:hypothetical protein
MHSKKAKSPKDAAPDSGKAIASEVMNEEVGTERA